MHTKTTTFTETKLLWKLFHQSLKCPAAEWKIALTCSTLQLYHYSLVTELYLLTNAPFHSEVTNSIRCSVHIIIWLSIIVALRHYCWNVFYISWLVSLVVQFIILKIIIIRTLYYMYDFFEFIYSQSYCSSTFIELPAGKRIEKLCTFCFESAAVVNSPKNFPEKCLTMFWRMLALSFGGQISDFAISRWILWNFALFS